MPLAYTIEKSGEPVSKAVLASPLKQSAGLTLINLDETHEAETIQLTRDHDTDIRFKGRKLGFASNFSYYGLHSRRWTELTLYQTQGGKLICQRVSRTKSARDPHAKTLYIADSEQELLDKVGYSNLAKTLYELTNIDHAKEIE